VIETQMAGWFFAIECDEPTMFTQIAPMLAPLRPGGGPRSGPLVMG
jgi:hypothetical protein